MKTRERDRWKAIQRGSIYCSPGCGRGCTLAEYQKARRNADALAKRLGENWKPSVHENLGWYFRARSLDGLLEVSESGPRHFWCTTTSVIEKQFHASATTPRKAVEAVLKQMDEVVAIIQTIRTNVSLDVIRSAK